MMPHESSNRTDGGIPRVLPPLQENNNSASRYANTNIPSPSTPRDVKEAENINLERLEAEIESLLIYTKAVKWPTIKQTLTERRFLLRVFQLVFGLGAFLDIGYTSLINNYTSVVLESSGIPFFCFTSITSIFVSISNMFLYSFPGFLGIPPHRHHRVSRVETSFDTIICGLWIVATTQLAVYGKCPSQTSQINGDFISYIDNSISYCPTLQATLFLGGITCLLFLWRFVDGIRDQYAHKNSAHKMGKHIMFARGNWRD